MLDRALASILAQTFTDYEVIVVHDGPADEETVQVCEKYDKLFTQEFRFMALEENSGYQCVPKNTAIWHSRGDYIAFLDDDNEWTPDHLQALYDAIEEGTMWPDFVYGRREYVMDNGTTLGKDLYTGPSPHVEWNSEAALRLAAGPSHNFIDTSDFLIGRGCMWRLHLATSMMWNESLRRFADWELMTRGVHFAGWRGKAVDKILTIYHWHGSNIQLTRPAREVPTQVRA